MYCLSNFCFLCFTSNPNLVNINQRDSDKKSLHDKLQYCIQDLKYVRPISQTKICKICYDILRVTFEFKRRCLQNNEKLLKYVDQLTQCSGKYANSFVMLNDTDFLRYQSEKNYNCDDTQRDLEEKQNGGRDKTSPENDFYQYLSMYDVIKLFPKRDRKETTEECDISSTSVYKTTDDNKNGGSSTKKDNVKPLQKKKSFSRIIPVKPLQIRLERLDDKLLNAVKRRDEDSEDKTEETNETKNPFKRNIALITKIQELDVLIQKAEEENAKILEEYNVNKASSSQAPKEEFSNSEETSESDSNSSFYEDSDSTVDCKDNFVFSEEETKKSIELLDSLKNKICVKSILAELLGAKNVSYNEDSSSEIQPSYSNKVDSLFQNVFCEYSTATEKMKKSTELLEREKQVSKNEELSSLRTTVDFEELIEFSKLSSEDNLPKPADTCEESQDKIDPSSNAKVWTPEELLEDLPVIPPENPTSVPKTIQQIPPSDIYKESLLKQIQPIETSEDFESMIDCSTIRPVKFAPMKIKKVIFKEMHPLLKHLYVDTSLDCGEQMNTLIQNSLRIKALQEQQLTIKDKILQELELAEEIPQVEGTVTDPPGVCNSGEVIIDDTQFEINIIPETSPKDQFEMNFTPETAIVKEEPLKDEIMIKDEANDDASSSSLELMDPTLLDTNYILIDHCYATKFGEKRLSAENLNLLDSKRPKLTGDNVANVNKPLDDDGISKMRITNVESIAEPIPPAPDVTTNVPSLRIHRCTICSLPFLTHSNLKQHMKTNHSTVHECSICYMTFKYKYSLKRHFNVHKGEKVLVCPFCPLQYGHPHGLKTHCKNVHKYSPVNFQTKGFKEPEEADEPEEMAT